MGSQHQLQLFARRSYNMRKLKIVSKIILLISVLVTLLLFRIGFHIYENKYFFPWNALIPGSKNVAAAGQNNCQAIWMKFVLDHGVHHNDVSLDNSICHSGEDI